MFDYFMFLKKTETGTSELLEHVNNYGTGFFAEIDIINYL